MVEAESLACDRAELGETDFANKLAEVEDRHVMSGIRHRKRLEESE